MTGKPHSRILFMTEDFMVAASFWAPTRSSRRANPKCLDALEKQTNRPAGGQVAPRGATGSAAERAWIDVESAQPPLHLRPRLSHRAGDGGHVSTVFAQLLHQLVAQTLVLLADRLRGAGLLGRRADDLGKVLQLDPAVVRQDQGAGQALFQLAHVERPVVEQ